jgi:hypothetical protein
MTELHSPRRRGGTEGERGAASLFAMGFLRNRVISGDLFPGEPVIPSERSVSRNLHLRAGARCRFFDSLTLAQNDNHSAPPVSLW